MSLPNLRSLSMNAEGHRCSDRCHGWVFETLVPDIRTAFRRYPGIINLVTSGKKQQIVRLRSRAYVADISGTRDSWAQQISPGIKATDMSGWLGRTRTVKPCSPLRAIDVSTT